MRLVLLGTGSADGWPNPWCGCTSCLDQLPRGRRAPTSVLVDGRLLLDCGPEAPASAVRFGHSLATVSTVVIGHAHHDHLDPAFLLHRSWVSDTPLQVIGPPPVIGELQGWLAAGQTAVRLRTVTAGDVVDLPDHRLTALAANHEAFGEALLYLVEDGSRRLLYATDTGLLPEATLAALHGLHLDAVLLEETFGTRTDLGSGHLHLAGFAATLAALRAAGAVDSGTRVAAVHLSHYNPPLPALAAELARHGAEVHPDGTALDL